MTLVDVPGAFEGLEGVHHDIDNSRPKALIADQLPLNHQLISEYCSGVFPYLWNRAFSYGYELWIMDRKPEEETDKLSEPGQAEEEML